VTSPNYAFWQHYWRYLIVFPPPVVPSAFTYSFGVGVEVNLFAGHGSATFLSFVALGETPTFTGQELTVNNDGFPVAANLAAPTIRGVLNVNRSFLVQGGCVPAIALVMGVAAALAPDSEIVLSDNMPCFISPAATIDPETAVGPDALRGIVNFHYQPLPPETVP